jgi:hypothetical protein
MIDALCLSRFLMKSLPCQTEFLISSPSLTLFLAFRDSFFLSVPKREGEMRYQQDSGAVPGVFFFLIGLALLIVWLTQQFYL